MAMTNEQKAKEIAEYLNQPNGSCSLLECHQAAMAMAEWKDDNFEKILNYTEICYGVFQFNERERFIKKIKELYYGE